MKRWLVVMRTVIISLHFSMNFNEWIECKRNWMNWRNGMKWFALWSALIRHSSFNQIISLHEIDWWIEVMNEGCRRQENEFNQSNSHIIPRREWKWMDLMNGVKGPKAANELIQFNETLQFNLIWLNGVISWISLTVL